MGQESNQQSPNVPIGASTNWTTEALSYDNIRVFEIVKFSFVVNLVFDEYNNFVYLLSCFIQVQVQVSTLDFKSPNLNYSK